MNVLKAYTILNLKEAMLDRIALIWSIILPAIMLALNFNTSYNLFLIIALMIFIAANSYINGVGLHAVGFKRYGALKTFFSIRESRYIFFLSAIVTQMVFAFMSMTVVNIIAAIVYDMNFFRLILYSVLVIILCLPVAFLSIAFTLLDRVSYQSMSTISSMILLLLLIILSAEDNPINQLNPIYQLILLVTEGQLAHYLVYGLIAAAAFLIGLYCAKTFKIYSEWAR